MPALKRPGRAAGAAPLLALLLLASALAGCVAAVVPIVAGGALLKGRGDRQSDASDSGTRVPISLERPPVPAPAALAAPDLTVNATPPPVQPSPLGDPIAAAPWQPLVDYALARASQLGGVDPVESALLVDDVLLAAPDRLPCAATTAAVAIDLDQGQTLFAPASDLVPVPGLAESLAHLRAGGIVVLWISQADANRVTAIGETLVASGLDPTGRDPLLLARSADDRKQDMRKQANGSVCVVAIAGDRRADFDELFDYLLDPSSAVALDAMLGAGWFLTPAPFAAGAAEPAAPR